MSETIVVRGRYASREFIPDGPLPDAEGSAELIIVPVTPKADTSIFDLFGSASKLRSAEEIADQLREEHDSWGEP